MRSATALLCATQLSYHAFYFVLHSCDATPPLKIYLQKDNISDLKEIFLTLIGCMSPLRATVGVLPPHQQVVADNEATLFDSSVDWQASGLHKFGSLLGSQQHVLGVAQMVSLKLEQAVAPSWPDLGFVNTLLLVFNLWQLPLQCLCSLSLRLCRKDSDSLA